MRSQMKVVGFVLLGGVSTVSYAVSPQELTGKWQVGLTEQARGLPVGEAYIKGYTAGVFSFQADGSLLMETPCQHAEFNKKAGGLMSEIKGSWSLSEDVLTTTIQIKDQTKTDSAFATLSGRELVMNQAGGRTLVLGRFEGDTHAACENQ